jgi:hypothetical protein
LRCPFGQHGFNKKPAIGWQSRVFWKFLFVELEVSSHDANAASGAMPHGRLSIDALATQTNVALTSHFSNRANKHHPGPFVKNRFGFDAAAGKGYL